jgi:hypothetical protein
VLVHRPFSKLAQVITLPTERRLSAATRLPVIGAPRGALIEVPFVRLGIRPRDATKTRSTSKEIEDVRAMETRRGARRSVL